MSDADGPHPTRSTAAIVVIRRCFIFLQLLILQLSWLRACHEMRSYNGAMVTTMTGSLYETQKRLCHASSRTTEKSYADLVAHNTDAPIFSKAS